MTKKYDTLRFALCDPYGEKESWAMDYGEPGYYALKIFVNGQELNVLLATWEDKEDGITRHTKRKSWYGHPFLSYMLYQLQSEYAATDGVPLNCCSDCGCEGCWEVSAKISVGDEEVKWYGFEHSHRPYTYGGLEFHFERHAYDAQMKKLEEWVKKYGN